MRGMARFFLVAFPALLAAACGNDGEGVRREASMGGPGRIVYFTYCESCHGADGRGHGPMWPWLRTPPADLTRLSERYGTPLDRARLGEYIDGRRLVTAHGLREMPIWGEEFFEDVPPGTPNLEAVRGRVIEVLVDYLQTLQAKRHAALRPPAA